MANKELLGKVHKMIPPMLEHFHKGTFVTIDGSVETVCSQSV